MVERGLGPRFRAWVDRNLPTRESFESNRWLKPIAHRILHSSLWRMTRRSIPRGVALGMFTGILIPMGQIPASAVLALPLRANVPAAALTTFFTNPFTTPFLLVLYYKIGSWTLHLGGTTAAAASTAAADAGWLHWLAADVGLPTAVGMPSMDGPTMARHIRTKYPDLPILFMSGYAEEQLRKSIDLDNVAFLPKPFSVQQLAEAARDVLAAK